MRILTSSAALAAMALAIALSAMPASAAPFRNINPGDVSPNGGTTFDLGIDVSDVPLDAKDVNAYVAGLAPVTQNVIMSTCEHYVQNPDAAQTVETLAFCRIAVGS